MKIDFGKLNTGNNVNTILHPRELFTALPNKKENQFQYPRDVQSQVWDSWFQRRDESDLVIKMNTGSGKTIVGLLILKSSLNENKTPAVYITPDNYLVQQVINEAGDLGIETTTDTNSPRFLSGKAILIVNIHKLVNGKSTFGVGDEGAKIKIGTLLIDDAHACLDKVEEQFTLNITQDLECFEELYGIFRESLHSQCESKATEIEYGELSAYMQIPFWVWKNNIAEITKTLIKHKKSKGIEFPLPLLKESLSLCRCVVSAGKIEITPFCIPIHMIPSIINCERKIFMTATLIDDSILSSHFGLSDQSIKNPLVPDTAGDIGDRMILLPQVINTDLTDLEIKTFCKWVSGHINVVVIIPSEYRASFWSDQADRILRKDNLYKGIEELKNGKVGLVVLVNRYDGIDLPKDACRLLVIDNLPDVRRLTDKVNQSILMGSDKVTTQVIQRIEQGMGRGVRSSDDYCAIFLMGRNLTSQLYAGNATEKFSPATKAQFTLSEQLSEQIHNKSLNEIWNNVILHCINREQDWVMASKGVLASLTYDVSSKIDFTATAQRKAYDYATYNNYSEATKTLENAVNNTSDKILKSYLKFCLSEYLNLYDEAEAQKTLMSAASTNTRIIKPIEGIAYHKLESNVMDQSRNCSEFLKRKHNDPNKIIVEVNGLIEGLKFKPNTANLFEENMKLIANFIGFNSQRPEANYNKGPDVLWEVGGLNYIIIECKNGVTSTSNKINKHDCNQLNGSIIWFQEKYDHTCSFIPVLVHPSSEFEYAASAHKDTRIINTDKLEHLKSNIKEFIKSICIKNSVGDIEKIRSKLIFYKLRREDFLEEYTVSFT